MVKIKGGRKGESHGDEKGGKKKMEEIRNRGRKGKSQDE